VRNLGQRTERLVLKKIGARRQPRSGGIPGFPNDGVKGRYLIEVKSTTKNSLGLKAKWLADLEENSMARDKIPALIIVFNAPEDIEKLTKDNWAGREDWVAIPISDFERLTNGWKKS